jgi:hypothetical protein
VQRAAAAMAFGSDQLGPTATATAAVDAATGEHHASRALFAVQGRSCAVQPGGGPCGGCSSGGEDGEGVGDVTARLLRPLPVSGVARSSQQQ